MEYEAGKVVLFATAGSAPHRVLRGGVGSVNRRRPLKPVGPSSKELNCPIVFFGPHFRFIFFLNNFCYTVLRMKKIYTLLFALFALKIFSQTDIIPTMRGDLVLTPVLHATMVMQWDNKTIYIDPYGGAEKFAKFPNADVVIITHVHGDHLNKETLAGLDLSKTILVAPQSVIDELGDIIFRKVFSLKNGENIKKKGIHITAVPMYNLPETEDSRHPKGKGNGYVLTIGKKRFYISGDTEDIPEMRQLKNIDYAFVCMNLPYTMTVEQAADAVLAFQPKVVYPFHYRGCPDFSDIGKFKELVDMANTSVEVRLRNWYPE